jgi:hypothetical protein
VKLLQIQGNPSVFAPTIMFDEVVKTTARVGLPPARDVALPLAQRARKAGPFGPAAVVLGRFGLGVEESGDGSRSHARIWKRGDAPRAPGVRRHAAASDNGATC